MKVAKSVNHVQVGFLKLGESKRRSRLSWQTLAERKNPQVAKWQEVLSKDL
jgi:hypothetical protein